jgi:hypothetical protein
MTPFVRHPEIEVPNPDPQDPLLLSLPDPDPLLYGRIRILPSTSTIQKNLISAPSFPKNNLLSLKPDENVLTGT